MVNLQSFDLTQRAMKMQLQAPPPYILQLLTTDHDRTQNKLFRDQNTGSGNIFIVLTDHLLFNRLPDATVLFNPYLSPDMWASLL